MGSLQTRRVAVEPKVQNKGWVLRLRAAALVLVCMGHWLQCSSMAMLTAQLAVQLPSLQPCKRP